MSGRRIVQQLGFHLPITRRALSAAIATVVLAMGFASSGTAPAQAAVNGAFRGDAYGANATGAVGPVAAGLGKVSYIPCPCNGTKNQVRTATVNGLNVGGIVATGAVTGSVKAGKTSTLASASNSGSIAGVNLFGGLIRADAIKAVANIQATSSVINADSTGSTFLNLRIGNRPVINGVPAPNTRITLAGLGEITLNARSVSGNNNSKRIQVEMVVIRLTVSQGPNLPVGARITLAHAAAGFTRTTFPVFLRGEAYLALANARVGSTIRTKIGKQAFVSIPCEGTSGSTRTSNVTAINAGTSAGSNNVLDLDTGRTTAFGGVENGAPTARTTAEIAAVKLLKLPLLAPNGVIRITDLRAVSQTRWVNGTRVRSTNGSRFGTVAIAGVLNLPVNIPVNFNVPLVEGLFGIKIKLNEQILPAASSSNRTVVNMIKVTVTNAGLLNLTGLPVGSEILVGHADSGITN
jgi:hypothetical protein